MASPRQNKPRPVPLKNGGWAEPQSIAGQHLGNGKVGLPIPSHSKIAREGVRWYSSSTGMQVSSHWPITMWLPRNGCHYPGMESGEAKSLNSQVLCMILEYHLTCLS